MIIVGCVPEKSDDYKWFHIRSPLTNRCYEIAARGIADQAIMGMSEIPCSEYIVAKE